MLKYLCRLRKIFRTIRFQATFLEYLTALLMLLFLYSVLDILLHERLSVIVVLAFIILGLMDRR